MLVFLVLTRRNDPLFFVLSQNSWCCGVATQASQEVFGLAVNSVCGRGGCSSDACCPVYFDLDWRDMGASGLSSTKLRAVIVWEKELWDICLGVKSWKLLVH